jgi:hypothetical protein
MKAIDLVIGTNFGTPIVHTIWIEIPTKTKPLTR